ncbi:uncharacterized protein LOC126746796 [Anthonomus grandis grandis]|uniref:uncharacterized protein LOC126746796 n=1 Tax=Anthonomus grandis grandis TaxID=2921223 RepID=UPI002165FE3D|nr:uncharacterized protein LOC126746796 [Anthonomus grandis grandis]
MHLPALIIVFIVICAVNNGTTTITCYYCHQTSKACNSGYPEEIHQKNCSEDKCATMQYETQMPSRKVLATVRDCAYLTERELLHMVSPDKSKLATLIRFEECATNLCNFSLKVLSEKILVIVSFVIIKCFM